MLLFDNFILTTKRDVLTSVRFIRTERCIRGAASTVTPHAMTGTSRRCVWPIVFPIRRTHRMRLNEGA